MTLKEVKTKMLYAGVWNFENFQENDFMGSASINLSEVDLSLESSRWYKLEPAAL